MESSWNSEPEIPGETQVFEFSLILLRTVNEFYKNAQFLGTFERYPDGGFLHKGSRDLHPSCGRSGNEGLAYQFVKPFRMLLLGHHPAIIEDFKRGERVQLK